MRITLLAAAAILATSVPATAATLYSNPLLSGPIATPGSVNFGAASPIAQSGFLNFNLDGFTSLDGVNSYEDDFDLSLNGNSLLSLSYDLGGGGLNVIFSNPNGATVTGGTAGWFSGGQLQIALPVALLSGANNFVFSYTSPGPANGGGQGTGDEAWGVSGVVLTADQISAVPEASTWTMMIAGFGVAGMGLRARRKTSVRFA